MDGELDWSFVYRVGDDVLGEMGHPGEWTNDFEVWIEDVTANLEQRPSLAEQLVHFAAAEGSERLVAGAGAVIVDQTDDVVLPNWETHPGSAVAKVTFEGKTWFVLAMDPAKVEAVLLPYEGSVVSASTIDGFLDFLRDDGDRQVRASRHRAGPRRGVRRVRHRAPGPPSAHRVRRVR